MNLNEQRRIEHINAACARFNTTEDEVRKLLTTKCIARLGITYKEYDRWIYALYIERDWVAQKLDKKQLVGEKWVKAACTQLKISKETLIKRLTRGYVPLNEWHATKLRRFLSIEVDLQQLALNRRKPEVKYRDRQIAKLFMAGNTYREIAYIVGTTMGTIISHVNRMRFRGVNLPVRPPGGFVRPAGFNPKNVGRLLRTGMSVHDIAAKFNKNYISMCSLIARWRYTYPEANIPYIK